MTSRPHLHPIPTGLRVLPVCLILSAMLAGCGGRGGIVAPDETASAPLAADARAGGPDASLAGATPQYGIFRRIWPHEDGRSWSFRDIARTWGGREVGGYPTAGEVPRLSLDEARNLLEREPAGPPPEVGRGTYDLQFNGIITTMSGVTGQNLEESLVADAGAATRPSLAAPARDGRPEERFLELLRRARPDLAPKLVARGLVSSTSRDGAGPERPTLLHGYAWEQNRDWIGTYGDLNRQVAWIFLEADIRPGSEFTIQLVPDLADDVFLHARVIGWRSVETEAGVFRRALDVLYLVDFGISQATDMDGNPLGYFGAYLVGTVDYAQGVGPVRSIERFLMSAAGGRYDTVSEISLALTATKTGTAGIALR